MWTSYHSLNLRLQGLYKKKSELALAWLVVESCIKTWSLVRTAE